MTRPQILVEYLDGKNWKLHKTVNDRLKLNGIVYIVTILAGFITDFASIPRTTKMFFSPYDKLWAFPSLIHDALYIERATDRKTADLIFYTLMIDNIEYRYGTKSKRWSLKVKDFVTKRLEIKQAQGAYYSVRIGGWLYWDKPKSFEQRSLVQVNKLG